MVYDDNGKAIDYYFLDANGSYIDLTGVDPRGKLVTEAFPGIENDPFDWIGTFNKVATTGEQIRFEQYLQPNDRWYDCVGYQVKPGHFVAAFMEITKRKQAEEALHKSEAIKNTMVSNIGDVIVIIDQNEIIQYKSPNITKLFGWKPEELVGQSMWDNVHPDDLEHGKSFFGSLLEEPNKTGTTEIRYKRKDGSYCYIQFTAINLFHDLDIKGILGNYQNITDRKQAEEALRESEERFKALHNASFGGITIHDKGVILDCNLGLSKISGFSRDELIGADGVELLIAQESHETVMNNIRSGYEKSFEALGLRKNGEKYHVRLEARQIPYKGKNVRVVEFRDITESKKAEEELTKLSTAVTQSPSMIAITDTDGNIEYANPKFTKLTGYSLEEVIGQNFRILKSEEYPLEFYKEFWETISSGKTLRGEIHNKKKNGELYWESASISPIFDEKGNIINYIKVAEDITERKRNEQIQSIIHNISNAVLTSHSQENFLNLVKDELGKVIVTTNFFVALYDEKTDSISWSLYHDEKDRVEFFHAYPAGKTLTNYVIKTGKSLLAKKSMIEKLIKSGEVEQVGYLSEVWLGVPLKSDNKITGIFAVQSYDNENAFDETDVKILEIISHQISLSLERLKAEENLKLAKEKAEEMNRVKSYFFANMSHELRTPFLAIGGYAELLLETLTDPDDKELAEGIIRGADRLTDTLNKILSLTKLEFDKREIDLKEMNLSEVINDSFKLFSKTAEKKNLNFIKNIFTERSYNKEELIIKFDEEALRDLLNNLLSNAIKYTEKGSIELKTDIVKRNEGEFLVIKVTDTGIGIPKEKQVLIWDEFRQVSEGRCRNFQGTGLGLAITKKRVELLGGKISVESQEGKGSTFIVELPILRTGQVEKSTAVKNKNDEPNEPLETNSLQISKKILYVEDEKDAQNIVHKTLSNNYTIEIAINAEEALEKVKSQKYDAFLIDINLGKGITGAQLMEMIREMPEYKETPMMAITAFATDSDREEFLARGFTHYISKPFALKEFKKLVQEMFS